MAATPGKYGKWILQGSTSQDIPSVPDEQIKLRLFCIPQAGCGAWAYHGWSNELPPEVEVMPIELPGKNSRMMEPKQSSLAQLVEDIVEALYPLFKEKPFALIGHSMGAWLVYEVCKALQRRGEVLPVKAYVVCNRAPHLRGAENDPDLVAPLLGDLPAEEFWQHLERRYGKNPDLKNEAIKNFVFPVLQADFNMLETYEPSDLSFEPLSCPLMACGAVGDNRYSTEQLNAWKKHTKHYSEKWFEGNPDPEYWGTSHRFIIDNPGAFQEFLAEDLKSFYS